MVDSFARFVSGFAVDPSLIRRGSVEVVRRQKNGTAGRRPSRTRPAASDRLRSGSCEVATACTSRSPRSIRLGPRYTALVDTARGRVSRRIFSDAALYEREMERIFRRCWLFVGHESSLPRPGDFITSYMGEQPVIVWRDARGQVRVFLNTCPHRGNKLCLYDLGRAPALVCSYHGWSFCSEGRLVGVPFLDRAIPNRVAESLDVPVEDALSRDERAQSRFWAGLALAGNGLRQQ